MPEFVEEGARLVAEHISSLNLPHPYFLTPETSTISMAHVLRAKYGIEGMVLSKRVTPKDGLVDGHEYCAATSLEARTLYLPREVDLSGKDIIIFDNVTTTGETLKAVANLVVKRGWGSQLKEVRLASLCGDEGVDLISVQSVVLYTEGKQWSSLPITETIDLPITAFGHLPILPPCECNEDNLQYIFQSHANLPTEYGTIQFNVFKHRTCSLEVIACVGQTTFQHPEIMQVDGLWNNIPMRIHDACITSEAFHSLKCDCKLQLDKSLEYIAEYGGIVLYLKQEGRGIGLAKKIAAYELQETQGLDTVDANRALGLPDDLREYTAAKDVLTYFKIRSVLLMTNNQRKVDCLQQLGISVTGIIPAVIKPQSKQMKKYMLDKAHRMGHAFPEDL